MGVRRDRRAAEETKCQVLGAVVTPPAEPSEGGGDGLAHVIEGPGVEAGENALLDVSFGRACEGTGGLGERTVVDHKQGIACLVEEALSLQCDSTGHQAQGKESEQFFCHADGSFFDFTESCKEKILSPEAAGFLPDLRGKRFFFRNVSQDGGPWLIRPMSSFAAPDRSIW